MYFSLEAKSQTLIFYGFEDLLRRSFKVKTNFISKSFEHNRLPTDFDENSNEC